MDRQQPPDCAGAFLLGDRLQLLDPGRVLLAHEAHEALDVGASQLVVGARETRKLAQIRVAPAAPWGEHREVVVVLDQDLLAQPLEADVAGDRGEPVVTLPERLEQLSVPLGQAGREPLLEPRVERAAWRRPPQQRERVVGDADERRREHRDERLVVVAVVQQPQVAEQIAHLLLAEVPTPGGAIGRKVGRAAFLLVLLRVGPRCEEDDDLAGVGLAGLDELLDAARDRPGLAPAPAVRCVLVARLVGDEQLDSGPGRGSGSDRPRRAAGIRRRTWPRTGG